MESDKKGFLTEKRIAVSIPAGMTKFFAPKVPPSFHFCNTLSPLHGPHRRAVPTGVSG